MVIVWIPGPTETITKTVDEDGKVIKEEYETTAFLTLGGLADVPWWGWLGILGFCIAWFAFLFWGVDILFPYEPPEYLR